MVRQTKSCSQWTSPDCSKRNADEKILSKKIRTDVARFGRLQIGIVMMTVKGKLVKRHETGEDSASYTHYDVRQMQSEEQ